MLKFYKTENGQINEVKNCTDGCWASAVNPTNAEINFLINDMHIDKDFVRSALDEEESSRIENEDDQTLLIIDMPTMTNEHNNTVHYTTMPLAIVITKSIVLTISIKQNPIIDDFANGIVKNIQTQQRTRFLLLLLFRGATRFLQYLKQIDRISTSLEGRLHKSMRNQELIELLGLEKSLVYFSTSLKSNEVTLEKIFRGRVIKMYDEDQDLLEDVLIEVKQAIEMANIYSSILSGTMDAFASIISNNLNIVMKVLTSITILMAIPTMVFSYYGMNIEHGLFLDNFELFPIGISIVGTIIVAILLVKKHMFK